MSCILHERVLETIYCVGRRAALEDQLGSDKAGKSVVQFVLGKMRDGAQQRVGKLAPDRGSDLCHASHRREAVEPRHQRIVQRRRDRERRQRPTEHVTIRLSAEQTAL